MKIRRYKGTNREELYRLIHKEMGPDAIVVAPETSASGVFGRNRKFELIAILDDTAPASGKKATTIWEGQPLTESGNDAANPSNAAIASDLRRWSRQQNHQWKNLQATVSEIQKTVETLQVIRPQESSPVVDHRPPHAKGWDLRFYEWARQEAPILLKPDTESLISNLQDCLPIAEDFAFNNPRLKPHIVVMIGPTGSGKTTTLAKMAAICAHQHHLRVGIISIDTYRVAAVDQIREYASLLDMPLRVAFSAEDARAAMVELNDMDVILVDTPGRTHFDEMGLAVSHKMLRGLGTITPLLTIPATINPTDLPDVLGGFSRFDPHYLVITKVDETRQPNLFTALRFETDLHVAFVTNGQRVPQDIFSGNAERIARMLVQSPAVTPPVTSQKQSRTTDAKTSPLTQTETSCAPRI